MKFAYTSTPLINIASFAMSQGDRYVKEYLQFSFENKPPVQSHKAKLGKQNYCWNGEYRFWIWETESWRVFVSNTKGICFEVNENLSETEALAAWNHYLKKMKFKYNEKFLENYS